MGPDKNGHTENVRSCTVFSIRCLTVLHKNVPNKHEFECWANLI